MLLLQISKAYQSISLRARGPLDFVYDLSHTHFLSDHEESSLISARPCPCCFRTRKRELSFNLQNIDANAVVEG